MAADVSTLTRPCRAGMAAWRNTPGALLLALLVLAVGPLASAAAPSSGWQFGWADAGDHHDHAAVLELEAAPTSAAFDAPRPHLQSHSCLAGPAGPAASRAPLATRDRSPPLH